MMVKHFCKPVVLFFSVLLFNHSMVAAALPPPCNSGFVPAFSANTISLANWNEVAIRKVMQTFAYGGFASDQQIQAWSVMSPQCAIQEMLTFAPTNDLLSPPGSDLLYDNLQAHLTTPDGDSTLAAMQSFWSSTSSDNPVPDSSVYDLLAINSTFKISALQNTWIGATNKRGLNPFRQKVGFWLTNYHMSVHMQAVGNNTVLIRQMYDDVMRMLSNDPEGDDINYFADIMSVGAKSSTLAVQYGHKDSRYSGLIFYGNDDFAREFYQLFFGVLGEVDKEDYENVTIESMARILTGMTVERSDTYYAESGNTTVLSYYFDYVSFDPVKHYPAILPDLLILGESISIANYPTADDKIQAAAQIAINNAESEDNLPVWIISHFADDTLSSENDIDTRVIDIRNAWKNSNKNLLHFLRSYAISDQFHQSGAFQNIPRFKYRSAFDRNMLTYNQNTIDNKESYLNTAANPRVRMQDQGAKTFYPSHFVFGGQTGIEAANNPDIFKEAYNANILSPGVIANASNTANNWQKEWSILIPPEYADASGLYRVGDVASWLWNRFIADAGVNFGLQERFYVTGLMAMGNSFDPLEGYTENELDSANPSANAQAIQLLSSFEDTMISVDSNKNIGLAINFITVTPYMFVQLGSDIAGGAIK